MVTPVRTSDVDVGRSALREIVESEPFRFRFFQAVRLLRQISPESAEVGNFAKPAEEVARFSAHQSTSFPASEIQGIEFLEGKPARVTVNFMGLTGPEGLLPLYYTEYLMQRARAKDRAAIDFFDIFNHRAISLFYRGWEKYRLAAASGSTQGELPYPLLSVIGLDADALRNRQDVEDEALIYFAGLFSQRPRSALALKQLLMEYFDVPVTVEQFAGSWHRLDAQSQTRLDSHTYTGILGKGAVIGDEVWDQQCLVRIRLGPLELSRYIEFLPTGSAWRPLRALVRFFFNDQLDFELQLQLKRSDTPPCELGSQIAEGPRLGWITWITTKELGRDPGETVLRL